MLKSPSCPDFLSSAGGAGRKSLASSKQAALCGSSLPRRSSSLALAQESSRLQRMSHSSSPPSALPIMAPLPLALREEIQMESSLHVTWFAAAQCESTYGAPDLQTAPSLQFEEGEAAGPFDDFVRLADSRGDPGSPKALAACLATPSEGAPEPPEVGGRDRANVANRARSTGAYEFAMAEMSEEIGNGAMMNETRWSDWVRRIRRKRMNDTIQGFLTMLSAPAPISASVDGDDGRLSHYSTGIPGSRAFKSTSI